MGRLARGSVRWNMTTKTWECRVTLADGKRSRPIAMTGLPACVVTPDAPPRGCACASCMLAGGHGRTVSDRLRSGAHIDTASDLQAVHSPSFLGVYFARMTGPSDRPIKIGFGRQINRRIAELSGGLPWPLDVLAYVRGATPRGERLLHGVFSRHRVGGEWFMPDQPVRDGVAFFRARLQDVHEDGAADRSIEDFANKWRARYGKGS